MLLRVIGAADEDWFRMIFFWFVRLGTHRLKQRRFNAGRTPEPPEDAGQSKDEFALDGRLGVVVSNDRRLEGLVIFRSPRDRRSLSQP